jgi:hypothetical protein
MRLLIVDDRLCVKASFIKGLFITQNHESFSSTGKKPKQGHNLLYELLEKMIHLRLKQYPATRKWPRLHMPNNQSFENDHNAYLENSISALPDKIDRNMRLRR